MENTSNSKTTSVRPQRMVQAIICMCGARFAACVEPHCYTDADWQKDVRKYVKRGCTIKMIDASSFRLEKCNCYELVEKTEEAQKNMF